MAPITATQPDVYIPIPGQEDRYQFFVQSKLIENHDTGSFFQHNKHLAVTRNSKGEFVLIADSLDAEGISQLYAIIEVQGGKTPTQRHQISDIYWKGEVIVDVIATQDVNNAPILAVRTAANIFLCTDMSNLDALHFAKISVEHQIDHWDIHYTADGLPYFVYSTGYTAESDPNIYILDHEGNVINIDLPINISAVKNVYLGRIPSIDNDDATIFTFMHVLDSNKEDTLILVAHNPSYGNFINHLVSVEEGFTPTFIRVLHQHKSDCRMFIGGKHTSDKTRIYELFLEEVDEDEYEDRSELRLKSDFTFKESIFEYTSAVNPNNPDLELTTEAWLIGKYKNRNWLFKSTEIGDGQSWTIPTPLMPIDDFRLVRNPNTNALDLFVPHYNEQQKKYHIEHHWRDQTTSLWKSQFLSIYDTTTRTHKTNSTYIRITNKDSIPFLNKGEMPDGKGINVRLSASQEVSVMVNGTHYQLNPNEPDNGYHHIPLDSLGGFSIINKTESIQTPIYLVHIEGLSQAVRIRTTAHTSEQLQKKGKDGFLQKIHEQHPIYKPTSEDTDSLQHIHGFATRHMDNKPSVSIVPKEAVTYKSYIKLVPDATDKPKDIKFVGLSKSTDGNFRFFNDKQAWLKHHSLDDNELDVVSNDFMHWAGDLIHSIKHLIDDVEHLAIEFIDDAYHFTVRLTNSFFKAVLHNLEEMWGVLHSFLSVLLKKIEAAIADILFSVLALIIDWNDVLAIQQFMENTFSVISTQFKIDYKNPDSNINQFIDGFFDFLRRDSDPPDGQHKADHKQGSNIFSYLLNNPITNFIGDIISRALAIFNGGDVLKDLPKMDFAGDLNKFLNDLVDLITDVLKDLFSLDFKKLTKDLHNNISEILGDVADVGTDMLKVGFEVLNKLIDYFEPILTKEIHIPILSELYQKICKSSDHAVESDKLSILRLCTLVLSIPIKLITSLLGNFNDVAKQTLKQLGNAEDFKQFFKILGREDASELIIYNFEKKKRGNVSTPIGKWIFDVLALGGSILAIAAMVCTQLGDFFDKYRIQFVFTVLGIFLSLIGGLIYTDAEGLGEFFILQFIGLMFFSIGSFNDLLNKGESKRRMAVGISIAQLVSSITFYEIDFKDNKDEYWKNVIGLRTLLGGIFSIFTSALNEEQERALKAEITIGLIAFFIIDLGIVITADGFIDS